MMRRYIALLLLPILALSAAAQDKKEEKDLKQDRAATKALMDSFNAAYPQLDEQIKVTIEDASPLGILTDPDSKEDFGLKTKFKVMLKNIGEREFKFVPGNVQVQVLDEQGVALPQKHVHRRETTHGDTGTYPIAPGKTLGKPIALVIEDDSIKPGQKYLIVASYARLWDKPSLHGDFLSAARFVEATRIGLPKSAFPKDDSETSK